MSHRHHPTLYCRRGGRVSTETNEYPHAEGWTVGEGDVGGGSHRPEGPIHERVAGLAGMQQGHTLGTGGPHAHVAAENRHFLPQWLCVAQNRHPPAVPY